MKYLVQAEFVDPGPLLPPEQLFDLVEGAVAPSLEKCAQLEQEGKILGGLVAGARAGAFIVEAESNDEVSDLVAGLPFWGLCRWQVTPLEDWTHRREGDLRRLAEARGRVG